MKTAILYTVFTIINLIGFVIGVLFLPDQVPIHFNSGLTADVVGSPWVYVALPAAAALVSTAIWTASISKKLKDLSKRGSAREIVIGILAGIGAILAIMGWIFFALIASGVKVGEKANFPIPLVTILPLSVLVLFFGNYLSEGKPENWLQKRIRAKFSEEVVFMAFTRLSGILFLCAGLISAVCAIIFSCLKFSFASLFSAIVFVACVLIAVIASLLFARRVIRFNRTQEN